MHTTKIRYLVMRNSANCCLARNKKKNDDLSPCKTDETTAVVAVASKLLLHDADTDNGGIFCESRTRGERNQREQKQVLDAVIIGAGWAGLGAGEEFLKKCKEHNNDDDFRFCILEGQSQIGGRSRTLSPISDEYPNSMIEIGSQWIQGSSRMNPIYRLALAHDMLLHYDRDGDDWKTGRAAIWYDRLNNKHDGGTEDGVSVDRLHDTKADQLEHELLRGKDGFYPYLYRYPSIQKKRWKQQSQDTSNPPSVSVHDAFEEYCDTKKLTSQKKQFLRWLLEVDLTQEYAASIEDIDAEWWDHDKEYSGGDLHFGMFTKNTDGGIAAGGYSALIHKFAQSLLDANLIRCNCIVSNIDYTMDPVMVEYVKTNCDASSEHRQSTTRHRIYARSVLCTVPLGVLKSENIQFSPPLPPAKRKAIQKLGVGFYNKVVLVWDPKQRQSLPWLFPLKETRESKSVLDKSGHDPVEMGKPTRRMWMERIHLPGKPQGPWTVCYNAHTHHTEGGPVLLYFFLGGRFAEESEKLSDQEIQSQAIAALRDWFGSASVPDPRKMVRTRWGHEEFAKGSYSYYHVGSSPQDRATLAEPLGNRLFFAGEACHLEYYATTHGALTTGQKEAKLIWKQHRT